MFGMVKPAAPAMSVKSARNAGGDAMASTGTAANKTPLGLIVFHGIARPCSVKKY